MADWTIIRKPVVASTMDEIDALGQAGASDRTVVVADEQTAGRGRAGRRWTAPSGAGLFLSMLVRTTVAPARMGPLPLLVGLAVAEAIETCASIRCLVKWPNDVLAPGGKIAGVLVTTKLDAGQVRFVNIGAGVNCAGTIDALPPGAASIFSESRDVVTPSALLPIALNAIGRRLGEFERADGRPGLDDWLRRAAFLGGEVVVVDRGEERAGQFVGVAEDGALLLEMGSRQRLRVVAGDLTRGPRRRDDL
jgi:BirA family biotin operon repressor/biotin-[acetyl-CoA-carboxylase] ligase